MVYLCGLRNPKRSRKAEKNMKETNSMTQRTIRNATAGKSNFLFNTAVLWPFAGGLTNFPLPSTFLSGSSESGDREIDEVRKAGAILPVDRLFDQFLIDQEITKLARY